MSSSTLDLTTNGDKSSNTENRSTVVKEPSIILEETSGESHDDSDAPGAEKLEVSDAPEIEKVEVSDAPEAGSIILDDKVEDPLESIGAARKRSSKKLFRSRKQPKRKGGAVRRGSLKVFHIKNKKLTGLKKQNKKDRMQPSRKQGKHGKKVRK